MKKSIFLIFVTYINLTAIAQLNVSTNLRVNYTWNDTNNEWEYVSQDDKSSTFFEFNEGLTMVKHTTEKSTVNYKIKSSERESSDGKNQIIMMIISDVGEEYMMIFDIKEKKVAYIPVDDDFMVEYSIKSTWRDD